MAENVGSSKEKELHPVFLMVSFQAANAGVNVFYKLAAADGMKMKILIAYRLIFATIFMAPLAFFLERKTRPKLTWRIALLGFLCSLFGGAVTNNLFAESLLLTSTTVATAMLNLLPAITFILAIIMRLESLGMKTWAGKAKVAGTMLSIGGAMTLTLYKGLEIKAWPTFPRLLERHGKIVPVQSSSDQFLGSLLAFGSCLTWATMLIFQSKLSETYPCYSSTVLTGSIGSILSTIYAVSTEKDWSEWKLGWNIRLLTVVYTGIFFAGIMNAAMAWCSGKKGALYISSFYPLGLIFVAFVASPFVNEKLHVGSIIGSVLIIAGLYTVLWGKHSAMKMTYPSASASASAADNDDDAHQSKISRESVIPMPPRSLCHCSNDKTTSLPV